MKNPIYFSLLICFLSINLQAQKLNKTERKIVQAVKNLNRESLLFLEKVVNINSGTLNQKGVKDVGNVFSNAFQEIGFQTQWIEMPDTMNRAGHLFASIDGKKGKKLLLIGHLDTVFEKNSPFQTFERINDSMAYGPGANDMKGGDVVVLYALKALANLNLLKNANITVAFTGDEESTGKPLSISRKALINAGKKADIALGFENATGFNNATIARRGASGWKVEVKGKRAHSSGVFNERVGAGAVFEMSRILNAFYEEVRGEEYLTFNPGTLLGGTFVNYNSQTSSGEVFGKTNVVAQTAVVNGGLRFISEEQKEKARAKMREIISQNLPQTTASISFTDSYPAMGPTKGNKAVLEVLSEVSQDLGFGPVTGYDPSKRGAADISFVADYVDGLDGLGTMGNAAHTPQETVNLKTVNALIQRAAVLIYRLTR
ncbi:MAG: M20/M25/M40 family metallo-hydrolase [Flavobacteriaceae bacterium]|nr:M20/M25/M40 family metallo-hydrolase [Flavobacteriaceae bacterium]